MKIAILTSVLCLVATSTLQAQQKILAEDGAAEDFFGFSVAISGDTAVVGAYKAGDEANGVDAGAAYVFTRSGDLWQQQGKLTAHDGQPGDTLGGNVAISGNTAIAGAIGHDANGDNAGAVYVFERQRNAWQQSAKLMPSDSGAGDAFGQSVAIFGDTMVIGAPHDDDRGDGSGSVYVFVRAGSNWEQKAKLKATDGSAGDLFGISVSLTHNTILIGADLNDETATDAGAAYVFVQNGGEWVQQAKLMASDGAETDIFGVRVALFENTALISARRDDHEGAGVDAGSAYVFTRVGTKWSEQAKLIASDSSADDRFGRDVALIEDTALIGAMHQDEQGENSGALYVFKRDGTSWHQLTKLTAEDGAPGDLLGWSVATSQSKVLVGVARSDDHGLDAGAAYIFDLNNKLIPGATSNAENSASGND